MTPENQILVRESFAKVVPTAPQAAVLFYDRLFVLDPSLRPLSQGDMAEQGRKLMTMIGTAVANLAKFEAIVPAVQDLGAGTRATACNRPTMTLSPPHCSGRRGKGWATPSRRRWKPPGRKRTRSWRP